MSARVEAWLRDPFLSGMFGAIRAAGPLRSIAVDLTRACNIRCTGCYFFAEGMDALPSRDGEPDVDRFVERERARGTNFVTVVGGEPALALERLKALYDAFKLSVATNGLRRIPRQGFEQLPIGVSVWGDHATDRELRGGGKLDVFRRALANYRGDERAFWYYTVAPGHANEVEGVVERCVDNGNRVLFNFYGDLERRGGELDHARGFAEVRAAIERAIEHYPERILMTARLAEVVSTGRLFDLEWGHSTCASISSDHPANRGRIQGGVPFDPHFRAYNADLATTRRCCTGIGRECSSCFDTWQHFSWVMLHLKKHMASQHDFTQWLTTTYLFYFINRLVDVEQGAAWLPEIHRRARTLEFAKT